MSRGAPTRASGLLSSGMAAGRRVLARADALANRLYGAESNPLYHSGALAVWCFVIVAVTGLYLLLFYRISAPYASVERIDAQLFTGRWIRSLHRYASDLAVIAAVVHAFRMAVQDRAWGPRALAWISGVFLLLTFLVCGWTGYVMVWDTQGQVLAMEGAQLLDALPLFAEPIGRTFVGEEDMPRAFFFMNLFAHIAIPVGILLVLWIHVSRLARTYLLPPRGLRWVALGFMSLFAVVWPAPLGPEADLVRIPQVLHLDVFYNGWLPIAQRTGAGFGWLFVTVVLGLPLLMPVVMRRRGDEAPPPSWVNPRFCTGCEQCYHDCPYEAISMVPRNEEGRSDFVGLVDPLKCVSCGICAGSCAPMGVGPEGRTGRDQLADVRDFVEKGAPAADEVVLIACERTAAGWGAGEFDGSRVVPVSCAGSLHTSVIEYLVRAGAGGVMVVACPPRDCWNREGGIWLEERIYNNREAELKDRVDRRHLRVTYAAEGEKRALRAELDAFRGRVRSLQRALTPEKDISIDTVCEVPTVSVAEESSRWDEGGSPTP